MEKVDSSLEKQGYMGERREGLAVMKGGSIQRTTGGGCLHVGWRSLIFIG